jgi:hypothetical protein
MDPQMSKLRVLADFRKSFETVLPGHLEVEQHQIRKCLRGVAKVVERLDPVACLGDTDAGIDLLQGVPDEHSMTSIVRVSSRATIAVVTCAAVLGGMALLGPLHGLLSGGRTSSGLARAALAAWMTLGETATRMPNGDHTSRPQPTSIGLALGRPRVPVSPEGRRKARSFPNSGNWDRDIIVIRHPLALVSGLVATGILTGALGLDLCTTPDCGLVPPPTGGVK